MIPNEEQDVKTLKTPSLLHSFVIIIILLISIIIFNLTLRGWFGSSNTQPIKEMNVIFDPDVEQNWTILCPYVRTQKTIHNLKWKATPCFNRTLLHWHLPWVRVWVWKQFRDVTEERKRLKNLEKQRAAETQKEINAQSHGLISELSIEENNGTDSIRVQKQEEKPTPSSLVYTILTAMTLMLTILASLEFLKEKFGKQAVEENKDEDRRCSLADFTLKRHMRKESQQESVQGQAAFDEPKKVKELLHQGSLGRAISNPTPTVIWKLSRQKSMPCHSSCTYAAQETKMVVYAQASFDLSEGDGSPSMRRKSRHFIRRH